MPQSEEPGSACMASRAFEDCTHALPTSSEPAVVCSRLVSRPDDLARQSPGVLLFTRCKQRDWQCLRHRLHAE
jgi:hypothetical protein